MFQKRRKQDETSLRRFKRSAACIGLVQIVEFEIQGKHLQRSVKPDRGQAFIIILIKEHHTTYYTIGVFVFWVILVGVRINNSGLSNIDFVCVLHLQELLFKDKYLLINKQSKFRKFFTV